MNLRIKAVRSDCNPWGISLVAFGRDDSGNYYLPESSVVFKKVEPSAIVEIGSSVILPLDNQKDAAAIQGLMDSMWEMGFRPSDIGTPGHLAATQKHLQATEDLLGRALDQNDKLINTVVRQLPHTNQPA